MSTKRDEKALPTAEPERSRTTRDIVTGSVIATITSAVAIFGTAWIQGYVSQRNAERNYAFQRRLDARERAYVKLRGLSGAWNQAVRTWGEAMVSAEFYRVRYRRITHDDDDLAEFRKYNDRAATLVGVISGLTREVFEAYGEATIHFDSRATALKAALDDLKDTSSFSVNPVPLSVKTEEALDRWRVEARAAVAAKARGRFGAPVEALAEAMLAELKAEPATP